MYIHIPLSAYRAAWEVGDCVGSMRQSVTPPTDMNGTDGTALLFDAILESPEVVAVFAGHDHYNDVRALALTQPPRPPPRVAPATVTTPIPSGACVAPSAQFCCKLSTVHLCYARKTGYGGHWGVGDSSTPLVGMRLLELSLPRGADGGTWSLDTRVRLVDGSIVGKRHLSGAGFGSYSR